MLMVASCGVYCSFTSAIVSDAAETEAVVELLEVQFVNLVQLLDLLVGQKLKVGVHKFLV